jgi:ribosome-associated translation inhibitor RaiA
MLLVRRRLK